MLIDEVTIKVLAGDGGKGAVAFNKNMMSRGPVGGRGGTGGSVYFEGVSNLATLSQFRYRKVIKAGNGQDGRGQFRDGANSPDLTVKIPVGTLIRRGKEKIIGEVTRVGQKILIVKGGRGGRGNFLFRSATNTTPQEFENGKTGQKLILNLEMKMIADVGIIGLPNVGKSSLINELTKAKSKVANYNFTTLEPFLGSYDGLIIADIPGLIEGASKGKGLGHKFLRHIERTKVLFHLVSSESLNPLQDYQTIRQELGAYNKKLLEKPEYLFLSKSDLKSAEGIEGLSPQPLSIYDAESLEKVKEILNALLKEKTFDQEPTG